MRKTLSTFVSLLLVVPLFAPGVLASPSDEGDVRKAVKTREEAWDRHDMEAFAPNRLRRLARSRLELGA
jgi:hypothetical protein